jgi:ABC-type sugar transport system ATPase subunit
MTTLQLERLTKVYEAVRALDEVDLTIDGSELVAVVGPSGCGKTTLLRLLAGLETPTGGRIVLNGRDLAGVAPAERRVAMVFQDHALYPSRSVRDNLAYPLRLMRLPPAEVNETVRRTADRLGLTDVMDARPGELSGGQRQRVALGRALVRRPALFLFDEPLSSLDAGLRRQLRRLIKQLQREAQTPALYVTHDQEEALALADVLVVLDRGRVRQVGPPAEVYQRPADRFVANFVGAGMNFIEGRLEAIDGKVRFAHPGGVIGVEMPAAWAGRAVALGFRPEALRLGEGEAGVRLRGTVRLVEYQGDRLGVTLEAAGATLLGSFPADANCREGDGVEASLAIDRCLWFESGPEGRLLAGMSPGVRR